MKLREDLNALTPRLRRYARALLSGHPGGCDRADDLVHATLLRALGSRNVGPHADLVIRLYATLTQMHREVAATTATPRLAAVSNQGGGQTLEARALSSLRHNKLTVGLLSLPLDEREALLLVSLEGFGHDEAARILHITKMDFLDRLTRGRLALDARLRPLSPAETAHSRRPAGLPPHLRLVR